MNKTTIIVIITVLVLGFGVYTYYTSSGPVNGDSATSVDSSVGQTSSIKEAREISQTLNKVKSLVIDDSIFNTSVYRSLVPSLASSTQWVAGRPNPFAPLNPMPLGASIISPTKSTKPVRTTSPVSSGKVEKLFP